MNRDQVLSALMNKLRELDIDDGIVGVVAVNEVMHGTKVFGIQSENCQFGALQFAQCVLDIAASVKHKVGQL